MRFQHCDPSRYRDDDAAQTSKEICFLEESEAAKDTNGNGFGNIGFRTTMFFSNNLKDVFVNVLTLLWLEKSGADS